MKTIILAGGSGSRLWPLSNDENPKQLLSIDDNFTLLQNTFLRAMDFSSPSDILTVTNDKFRIRTAEQLEELYTGCRILSEPFGRNTAPAIACALKYLEQTGDDDIVTILPADHLIRQKEEFRKTIELASELASDGYIVTLGIKPYYPEIGFGYIKAFDPLKIGFKVERFEEKPTFSVAEQYVQSGDYYWNGGIFVGKISVFMQEFAAFAPDIADIAGKCTFNNNMIDADLFAEMPKISIDYAIMEKSEKIALVKLLSDWSDLGSWQAIYDLKEKDEDGNVVIGNVELHNVKNSFVYSPERFIAVADMENIVLVNTSDTTMICNLNQSQNVKILSEKIK